MQTLNELIDNLPPELQDEVRDFIEFLLEKKWERKSKNQNSIGLALLKNLETIIPP